MFMPSSFFFQAEDGIRDRDVTGVQTCALPILARTDELERATALGRSIELAEASVVGSGNSIWLFLRHSDAAALYRFDASRLPAEGTMSLGKPMTELPSSDGPIPLTRPDLEL